MSEVVLNKCNLKTSIFGLAKTKYMYLSIYLTIPSLFMIKYH